MGEISTRKPHWLKTKVPVGKQYIGVREIVEKNKLHTICTSGHCPNMAECWGVGTATLMILGDICTRACKFCNVKTGRPLPADWNEPDRVAESINKMGVKHAVITSVDRDDLDDGGAEIWALTIKKIKEAEKKETTAFLLPKENDWKFGTVGCVALDKNGNIATGTSTGGMTNKRWGRIGDSPIIGAGTYANNTTCGVSSTGWGEFFIRAVVAHDISALMEYKGMSLKEAARKVIQEKIPKLGGDGGIVAIDHWGNIVMEFNTSGMFRASMDENGTLNVHMFKNQY